ncbi:MAG TPA: hypothetical protein ENI33_08075 [Thermoplasmatales archaeon]|nr:hypothetical protein [Thermoplasmatales archaeon]
MKRVLIVLLAFGVLLANVTISGMEKSETFAKEENKIVEVSMSKPYFEEKDGFMNVVMENANYMHYPGMPMLPYYTKIYYFPFGTKVSVECYPKNIEKIFIDKKIMPAKPPKPLSISYTKNEQFYENEIYESSNSYPDKWFDYRVMCGLVDGEHKTIVAVYLYPIKYNPALNEIEFAEEFELNIKEELPKENLLTNDEYDLLIICPEEWRDAIQPLVNHKENHGIRTVVETVEEIYSTYEGRDGAEKVKYFIKDELDNYGIDYVLLVGGKKSYLTGNWGMDGPHKSNDDLWYVPVRYVALNDMAEGGYISDLYYADIYDGEGNFSTWDTNNNGIFGEWSFKGKDRDIDFVPDVYVGRLACRSLKELQTVIDKIITYENTVYGQQWFNKMLLVGGDTFDDRDKICEGEVSTLWFYETYMADEFEKTSLFVSDGTLTFGKTEPNELAGRFAWINVIKAYSQGFGFVVFDGHGSPTAWATHFKDHASHNDPWVNGLMTYNMDLLSNGDKLPVMVIGGCHNSEFNISLLDFMNNEWTYQPTYECFSWHIVKMANKGAIATLGNTGLGYGYAGGYDDNGNGMPDAVEFNGGYIEDRFFNAYGIKGKDILGETWGTAVTDYILTYPPMEDQIDCKTIEEWILLGDPSLKIGGYS